MDLSLRIIEQGDLERIRRHRNEPATRRWLENQTILTPEVQSDWFVSGGARNFRMIQLEGLDIGLARLAVSDDGRWCTVGLDLFSHMRGKRLSAPAFLLVMQAGLKLAAKLDLWVFLDNVYAIRSYRACGFVHDHSTPVKFFTRDNDGQIDVHAYVRMVYKDE